MFKTLLASIFLIVASQQAAAACISESTARWYVSKNYPSAQIKRYSGIKAKGFGGDVLFVGKLPNKPKNVALVTFKKRCLLNVDILKLSPALKSRLKNL